MTCFSFQFVRFLFCLGLMGQGIQGHGRDLARMEYGICFPLSSSLHSGWVIENKILNLVVISMP